MSQDDWSIPGRALSDTVTVYNIDAAMAHSVVSREASEFDKCAGRFSKLCHIHANTVTLVQRIVYRGDAPQLVRYEETKKLLGGGELWVFHGTGSEQNFTAIMTEGLAAGGAPGVPVLNGAAHGQGVYTAVGAATPMIYSAKGGLAKVLLLKGIPGQIGVNHIRPIADWVVFKRGANPALLGADQLLPWCVVTFGQANAHAALAMPHMPVLIRPPIVVRKSAAAVAAAAMAAAAAAAAAKAAKEADAARDRQERVELQQALHASLEVGAAAKAQAANEDEELANAIKASLGEEHLVGRPGAGAAAGAAEDTDSNRSEMENAGIEYSPLELAIMESERTFRLEQEKRSSEKRGSNDEGGDNFFSVDEDDDDEEGENKPMWRHQPSRKKRRMRPPRAGQVMADLSDSDGVIVID